MYVTDVSFSDHIIFYATLTQTLTFLLINAAKRKFVKRSSINALKEEEIIKAENERVC